MCPAMQSTNVRSQYRFRVEVMQSASSDVWNARLLKHPRACTGADSPADGKSGFGMEMLDVTAILRNATRSSLVLMDEVGRGTEFRAGTAFAAATLESLAARGSLGIFATHLHPLLDLPLESPYPIRKAAMGIHRSNRRLEPTHKMLPNAENRESLAFVVAQDHNVPPPVLVRAQHFLADLPKASSHHGDAWEGGLGPLLPRSTAHPGYKTTVPETTDPTDPTSPTAATHRETLAPGFNYCATDPHTPHVGSRQHPETATVSTTSQDPKSNSTPGSKTTPGTETGGSRPAPPGVADVVALAQAARGRGGTPLAHLQIPPTSMPPATLVNRSVVYVLLSDRGYLYVGETDVQWGRKGVLLRNV